MKEKFILYKNNCKLRPWNSCMTEHIQLTETRSQIKNCKYAQTQWEDFFNETFLMKGLALLFNVFVIFTMFTV